MFFYCLAGKTQRALKGMLLTQTNTNYGNDMDDGREGCVKNR